MEKYGHKIAGSKYFRAFCCRCGEPMRIDESRVQHLKKNRNHYCEVCSPKHKGCSSPPSPLDDPDEYSSSWKIATGMGGEK